MLLQAKAVKADHGYLSAGERVQVNASQLFDHCLLYTSPSPRD